MHCTNLLDEMAMMVLTHLKIQNEGGSPGLLVKGGTHNQKVVSSNPSAVYWMDKFHIDLL